MKSDTPLDYAVFQLSPKRSRCELYVSSGGNTEKLASGLVKPFLTHLNIAEEQTASMVPTIKLEVGKYKKAETWFTRGTLERFVRFVSTPEILELVNTFDAEMSQLEAAQRIYSQGAGDPPMSSSSGDGAVAAADATKNELLRAIDVRLAAVRQDLTTSYTRAVSTGFTPDAVSELQLFADQFSASRLKESCNKFISLCEQRPDLINPWKTGADDRALRSSCESDMSIDEDPHEDQSKPATWQKPTKPSSLMAFSIRHSRESSIDKEEVKESEEKKEESANKEEPPVKTSQHIRRLSVQDRINLFENKQKESSGSSGGKPVVVGKSAELRRLSSDVSSAPEKAVLRRWSGVSDMSISLDLTGDRKDFESPLCTPSSSSVCPAKSEEIKSKNIVNRDDEDGAKQEKIIETKIGTDSLAMSISTSSGLTPDASEANKLSSTLERLESDFRKFQTGNKFQTQIPTTQTQSRSSRVDEDSLKNKLTFQPQVSTSSDERAEQIDLADQRTFKAGEIKEQAASERQNKNSRFKQDKFDLDSQLQKVSFKEVKEEEKKETRSSCRQSLNVATEAADQGPSKVKFQKQGSLAEQIKRSQTKREENKLDFPYSRPTSSKMVSGDFVTASAVPVEQVQKVKQAKGSQELNDELKMKANELEKLFAEHKRRVGPAEQPISGRGNDTSDNQMEQEMSSSSRKHTRQMEETQPTLFPEKKTSTESMRTSNNMSSCCVTPPVKPSSNRSEGEPLKNDFSEFGRSDGSRGKLYDKYTQKRDAKLREEWGSNRADKEAKMKALQDSFERSQAELEAKFSGSAYMQGSSLSSKRRAERDRSFNTRSNMKKGQHPIDFLHDETEGDLPDLVEKTPSGHARSLSETSLGDGVAKTAQTRKPLPNKTFSSSTSRTFTLPIPKSVTKTPNNSYLRRKMQSENPLAQSVPNFSDLKKENTKPSSGTTKLTRLQARNNSRNRNTTEDNPLVKEEKSRRSHSLRKSSFGTAEFKEWSSLDSDSANLNPTKIDKEQSEGTLKDFEPKPFLRKGSGVGPGAGTLMAKMKASIASEILENEEDFEVEELDTTKYEVEEEEEEPEAIITEDHRDIDNGKPRLSQDSGSESGEALRSFSQINPSFAVESPVSWNSRMQHAFSYANETSDIDASAGSPLGSPASWNQAEADVARMRKKWGGAEKPFVVSSSTLPHPRKDVTKGFKRLLKFGRKSRGTDNLVDWISATTSEGDDDTEDGRDIANRSSEDLRKSRMGFSHTHTPDDVYNESEFYSEQAQALRTSIPAPPAHFKLREDQLSGSSIKAPRSFFSLSSFRSKSNDSKPR